jgi:flagellar export protein FliJ
MAPKPKYRLQPVLDQKEKAKKDAEQALAEAHRRLREEEEKKRALEQEKENALRRIEEAREKRDQKAMAGELTVQESQTYKQFIQGLHERRKELDIQIYKQTKAIERAADGVEKAKGELIQKAKEFEAMSKHKEQWLKQLEMEEQKKEQKLMEEIGMIQFMKRRAEKNEP